MEVVILPKTRDTIMSVRDLTKVFRSGVFRPIYTTAVKDVSFDLKYGTILSLIGESGSGKTTIGKLILKLIKPSAGKILYNDQDITQIKHKREIKQYYKNVQGIFQDPFATLNPLFRVDRIFDMIYESFDYDQTHKQEKIRQALMDVNLDPDRVLGVFPHQLSGGQLQRLLIARTLLMDVDILIADELISMLDASTRIGVLNLLVELCRQNQMAILFITHDLALGYYISDYTMILHKGRLVEYGATTKVYNNPVHPYTKMLLDSVPDIHQRWDRTQEFVPELIVKEIKNFYNQHQGRGLEEVETEHQVLFGI